jgi:hypothetical protein
VRFAWLQWQEQAVARWPEKLLRGLVHSDGTRVMNQVGERAYPRYFFTNHSADILQIFCQACDRAGVLWTRPTWKQVSVARAAHVSTLDRLIGPKR